MNKSRNIDDREDSSSSPTEKRETRRRRDSNRRENVEKSRDDSDSNLSNPQDVIPIQNGGNLGPNMWSSMMGEF